MFMFVTYPWPVPSANIEPPGPATAAAAAYLPGTLAEASTLRPAQVEELVCWTCRERLRLLWFRLRLSTSGICHLARLAREPRLKLP
jgi:hypothetical protein